MKNKHLEKIEREIAEVIEPVRNRWGDFTEAELEILLKKFGKICRDETSLYRNDTLSDGILADTLVKIGNKYGTNPKICIEIVSSIDNMHRRYGLKITDDIFRFLITQTKNRRVNFYVSIFITELPQFADYENKWEYILSIPDIAPRKKSIDTFYRVVKANIGTMPDECKAAAVKVFGDAVANFSLHEWTVGQYSGIIRELDN